MGITQDKDKRIQILRGIAILAVIIIHCPNAANSVFPSLEFNSWLIGRQLFNFPVAVFFYLAGKFTDPAKYNSYLKFVVKRGGARLAMPFLVWSLFYEGVNLLKNMIRKREIVIVKEIIRVFIGKASPQLYFVFVLIQLTLLTPILKKY